MKIRYFIILFFVFFAVLLIFGCELSGIGSSNYGSAQIEGYVLDASSNVGIGDVTIMTYPPSDSVYTDNNGNFFSLKFFLNTNPQEIMIIAEKKGYQTAQIKTLVKTDEIANVTIFMTRK